MEVIIRGTPEEIASFMAALTSPAMHAISDDDLLAVSQAICDRQRGAQGRSERLRNLRIKSGYTQQELAEMVKIRQNTLSQYETGRRKLTAAVAERLSRVLNCPPEDLLPGPPK